MFEIFCTKEEPKSVWPGYVSFHQVLQVSNLQPQYKELISGYTTNVEWMPQGERARKVISRSNSIATGKFPSPKNGRSIHCESRHELNAMVILENSDVVTSYHEQPAIITYIDALGVKRKHYPDILANLKNGNRLLLEIKSDQYANDTDTVWRTSHLHDQLKAIGVIYLLVVESQLNMSLPYIQRPLIGNF